MKGVGGRGVVGEIFFVKRKRRGRYFVNIYYLCKVFDYKFKIGFDYEMYSLGVCWCDAVDGM